MNPKLSYNIHSFTDMEVIGEGTYGKVFKAKLSESVLREEFNLHRQGLK